MFEVLKARKFPATEIIAVASARSAGKEMEIAGDMYHIYTMDEAIAMKPAFALFSAGGETSLEYAPKFAAAGIRVIDNSSAWRMSPDHKLVVPEINGSVLTEKDMIVANPNCSTIQLVMALAPLHRQYGVKRVVVSTYQSISGTGKAAVEQMYRERANETGEMVYPYPIDMNCLPHCDSFDENGYTKEELKLTNETKKILDPKIDVTATAVRVPVKGGHSESVNVSFEKPFELNDVRKLLHEMPGVTLQDNPDVNLYPMPRYAEGKDDVFVGRIRRDMSQENGLNMWVVADNLRKGAATNTVQIAEMMMAFVEKAAV
jgi:aspartate-semialdehyde dehydrogenase